jgi:hypothetical protein
MVQERKAQDKSDIINKEKLQQIKERIETNFYSSSKTLEYTATAIIKHLKKTR